MGLAIAAADATTKIAKLLDDNELAVALARMHQEAKETDGLDGFEFLTMAEAGEVGHWEQAQVDARSDGLARKGCSILRPPSRRRRAPENWRAVRETRAEQGGTLGRSRRAGA
jgi:hypothetical protein